VKGLIFWDMVQSAESHLTFRVKISSPSSGLKNKIATCFTIVSRLFHSLTPWRRKRHAPPKRRWTFNGLHGVISPEDRTAHHCRWGKISVSYAQGRTLYSCEVRNALAKTMNKRNERRSNNYTNITHDKPIHFGKAVKILKLPGAYQVQILTNTSAIPTWIFNCFPQTL
jgi:hypothetical protein